MLHRHATHLLHVARPSSLHAPCCHAPHGCAHYIALPLTAACIMSLYPSQLHALHYLAPHSYMHCIALPLITACPASPCPSRLHASHHSAPCNCMHHVALPLMAACTTLPWPMPLMAVHTTFLCSLRQLIICLYTFFFPFSTNFLFCSQLLCPNSMMVMWP